MVGNGVRDSAEMGVRGTRKMLQGSQIHTRSAGLAKGPPTKGEQARS